jgi:UDPglucose--hexose-1-phosphate uridylyltransferase
MSHLRQDVLTGGWVIFAPDRQERPNEYPLADCPAVNPVTCPFCPGREHLTLPEVLVRGRSAGAGPDSPGWRIRVVPNMFPALDDGRGSQEGLPPATDLFPALPGRGAHEVVVCTPDHLADLADLTPDHLAEILQVVRDRAAAMAADLPGHYVLPFGNHGREAGATLRHLHLQIRATPEIPATIRAKTDRLRAHRWRTGSCLACDLIRTERLSGRRLVAENEYWIALAPWASRFPWELALWPRTHQAGPTAATDEQLRSLAAVLRICLVAQRRRHGEHAFNLVFAGGPPRSAGCGQGNPADEFHWHLELTPRLTRLAGFETGTGFAINPVLPEVAADALRKEVS